MGRRGKRNDFRHQILRYAMPVKECNMICKVCNKSFFVKKSHIKRRTTCSIKCGAIYKSEKMKGRKHPEGSFPGELNPFFGKTHSEEARKKMSSAKKGKASPNKGKKYPYKPRIKMIGKIPWNKGKNLPPLSKERKEVISKFHKGRRVSLQTRIRQRNALSGSNGSNWIDGRTPLAKIIRRSLEFKQWRKSIFERDRYLCQECFTKSKLLHPHHLILFSSLLSDFLKKYSQFSPFDDKEILTKLAITHNKFWDITNGITLCEKCHRNKHKNMRQKKCR